MASTKLMEADEIASAFNGVSDLKYWRAAVAGSRINPEVHFTSRASMVRVAYRPQRDDFTVTFTKANAVFGDYLASAHRSLVQILAGLRAAGLPQFCAPFDETSVLRLEYGLDKDAVIHMANPGDAWTEAEPLPFKVPERKSAENPETSLDDPSTGP